MAVINDTVGAMMTCGYDDHHCEIGLIVGELSLTVNVNKIPRIGEGFAHIPVRAEHLDANLGI